MKIVVAACQVEELIKKSRFIGIISPCRSEAEALGFLNDLHRRYPDASHIVYAYRIQSADGLVCRFHDAGEPSSTAGKPIFQHLEGKQLINLLVAVVRYFGGVKLGAGGLTRAYGNVAKAVIEAADIVDYIEFAEVSLTLDYNQLQPLEYQLKKLDGCILAQDFSDNVRLTVKLPKHHLASLNAFLA
ncbi:IMPACT family protein [Methylomonas koyamae]|uniref:IMPACT family protein n=1 Tax=Methylomonas koyamae TaxID=702114 RepID=UPI00112B219D|nr:YigZ family protein [Methylomonas koyamae]TPQ28361.1 YigZ family protein [Methylomonas koyamae]